MGTARPSGTAGTLRVRNVVERAVVGLAEQGVRSSIVRLPLIAHSTTDSAGFLRQLIAIAQEKGFAGYPGNGANRWNAVHIRDAAAVFRLALEKGPAGRYWHAVHEGGIPFREIAEAVGSRLDLPAVSVPVDVLMLPGYFGPLTNLVTMDLPATSLRSDDEGRTLRPQGLRLLPATLHIRSVHIPYGPAVSVDYAEQHRRPQQPTGWGSEPENAQKNFRHRQVVGRGAHHLVELPVEKSLGDRTPAVNWSDSEVIKPIGLPDRSDLLCRAAEIESA
jgi:hypothetical protein